MVGNNQPVSMLLHSEYPRLLSLENSSFKKKKKKTSQIQMQMKGLKYNRV